MERKWYLARVRLEYDVALKAESQVEAQQRAQEFRPRWQEPVVVEVKWRCYGDKEGRVGGEGKAEGEGEA